jgi:perosamine synthetase
MVVTNDEALAERLRLLRNLGFTTPRFRHEVAGYNFRITAYQAAMGVEQVKKLDGIIAAKRRMGARYRQALDGVPGLQLPAEANWAKHVYWMYGIVVRPDFGATRDQLAARLRERGIDTRTFFCPMNAQPCFESMPGFRAIPTPVADMLWQSGLYLPSSHTLSDDTIDSIGEAIRQIQRARA